MGPRTIIIGGGISGLSCAWYLAKGGVTPTIIEARPWLGGVIVGEKFRKQGIGEKLCTAVEDYARSRSIKELYLFTLDKQAWYRRLGWSVLRPCVWHGRPGDIMSKALQGF